MTDELGDLEATIVSSSINFYGENNIIDIQGNDQEKRKHEGNSHTSNSLPLIYMKQNETFLVWFLHQTFNTAAR